MSYGGIKTYYLIFLDFCNGEYKIYTYEKDRRYTARQAWDVFWHNEDAVYIKIGKLPVHANINYYFDIIGANGLADKYCDRYIRLKP